jgi:hypothetical protein
MGVKPPDCKKVYGPPSLYSQFAVNVAGVTVIEGLVTDPVKLPEPVSVSCAAPSSTFFTDPLPDCVNVAYEGLIIEPVELGTLIV